MINIISSSSNSSCRQAKKWLKEHGLKFNEININNRIHRQDLTRDVLVKILSLCEDGTSQVLSKRKTLSPELTYIMEHFDELSFNTALAVLLEHPFLFCTPIIYDETKIQIGYNQEDMRKFVSKEHREFYLSDKKKK
jgi:regulatory protein spx